MESARRPLNPPSRERPTREREISTSRTRKNQLYGNSVAKKLALFSQSLSRSDRLSRENLEIRALSSSTRRRSTTMRSEYGRQNPKTPSAPPNNSSRLGGEVSSKDS